MIQALICIRKSLFEAAMLTKNFGFVKYSYSGYDIVFNERGSFPLQVVIDLVKMYIWI